ncbi:MAG: proton-conducting transporter membrane subunit, partial [Terrimicrobiaceae bacterium]
FGTLELPAILEQSKALVGTELNPVMLFAIAGIAFGAVLKSAQFPFHTWLPDTLETPTPVSALMHAGVISAGGFLLIRLSPLVSLSPETMLALALIGALTALFGSLVMLTQTSIKKSLAFSTVAQMGYMIMQCGLGAFALAALHLIAHSLYKAHAFLESGEAVSHKAPEPLSRLPETSQRSVGGFVVVLVAGLALCVGIGLLFGLSTTKEPGLFVIGSVLVMAITTLLWTSLGSRGGGILKSLAVAAGVCIAYFALHHVFTWGLQDSLPLAVNLSGPLAWAVFALIVIAFLAVFLLQISLPVLQQSALGQRLYVLIFNRFYVNALVNRLLITLWPVTKI